MRCLVDGNPDEGQSDDDAYRIEAKRTVETACPLWWDGVLELPDHQAQICVDGGYGK